MAALSLPWSRLLRSGQRLFLGAGAACPTLLMKDLLGHVSGLGELELFQSLVLGPSPWTEELYRPHLKTNAFFLDPRLSELVNAGDEDYTPAHYSDIPRLFAERVIRLDLALIMVSPPDEHGYCSLGPTVELTPAACSAAHTVVAQINPLLPRTCGQTHLPRTRLAHVWEAAAELPELPPSSVDAAHERLGRYVAQLIDDGDTLRIGVGPVGQGVWQALEQHRHLGLHSEVLSDAAWRLFERGVLDNSRKSLLPGKLVAGIALGSRDFYRFLDANPHVDLRPTGFVSDPFVIAQNERMVAVSSALEVDLTGQVVLDSVRRKFRAGLGSQVDFLRGAAMSQRGRPIIALPSTGVDEQGERYSRIVAELAPGAGVGVSRADVYYVVTEQGIATLRGRSVQERTLELIQVAHPDFREALLRAARAQNLVPRHFNLPPPTQDEAGVLAPTKVRLPDEQDYLVRPLNPADDRRLQEFFYSHTEETINRRYGFTLTRMTRERAWELVGVDQNRDVAFGVFALDGPRQVIRAVGRYYIDREGKGAEMAFVVAENARRRGMARLLLERMLAVARARHLEFLWAKVDRDNAAMLRLFHHFGARETATEEHEVRVEIPLSAGASSPVKRFLPFGLRSGD